MSCLVIPSHKETPTNVPLHRFPRLAENTERARLQAEAPAVKLKATTGSIVVQPVKPTRKPRVR